jgi:C1A family cysteine protease
LNLTDCKQCLVDSFPFGAGIAIYESFDSVGQDGIVPYPKKSEKLRGYHAISFFGYDEDEQVFICKNSWGTGFGDNGWFYLPYKFVENPRLCSDLWTIRKVENY